MWLRCEVFALPECLGDVIQQTLSENIYQMIQQGRAPVKHSFPLPSFTSTAVAPGEGHVPSWR